MSGIQEILLIAVIVLGIIFLPRVLPRQGGDRPLRPGGRFSRRMRIGIAASLVYPALAAACLQPWRRDPILFLYAGLGPVALGWLLNWVLAGFRKR